MAVVELAASYSITAVPRSDAPGVYVDGAKLASVGLRIRRGATYHGPHSTWPWTSRPFAASIPAVTRGLVVTSLEELGVSANLPVIGEELLARLLRELKSEGEAPPQSTAADACRHRQQ